MAAKGRVRAALATALVAAALTLVTREIVQPNDFAPYDAITAREPANSNDTRHQSELPGLALIDLAEAMRSRAAVADAVDLLTAQEHAHPRAIALDLVLDYPAPVPEHDERLAAAIRRARERGVPVIVAVELNRRRHKAPFEIWRPLPIYVEAGVVPGIATTNVDEQAAVREVPAYVMDGHERVFGFSALLAHLALGEAPAASVREDGLLPEVREGGSLLVIGRGEERRWIRLAKGLPPSHREGARARVEWVPGENVFLSLKWKPIAYAHEQAQAGHLGAAYARDMQIAALKDRVCLLGWIALDRNPDVHYVPGLPTAHHTPGAWIHAQAARTLAVGQPPLYPSFGWVALLTVGAALAASLLLSRARSAGGACAWLVALLGLVVLAAIGAFIQARWFLPLYNLAAAPVLVFGIDVWRRLRQERAAILAYFTAAATDAPSRSRDADGMEAALPYPIAQVRASVRTFPAGRDSVGRLLDLAEVTIKTLAAIAVCDAIRLEESAPLRRQVAEILPHPSLGQFVDMLREATRVTAAAPLRSVVPELAALYAGSEPGSKRLRKAIDRLVELRNKLHHGANAPRPTEEHRALASQLAADLDGLLARLAFLRDYPLVRFASIASTLRNEDGTMLAGVHLLMGSGEAYPYEELRVRDEVRSDELAIISRRTHDVLGLAPLVAWLRCRKHAQDEVAFINGLTKSGRPHYLSYVRGCKGTGLTVPKGAQDMVRSFLRPIAIVAAAGMLGGLMPAASAIAQERPPDASQPPDEPEPEAGADGAAQAATAELPFAVCIVVTGEVILARRGEDDRALRQFDELRRGDRLTPKSGAQAVVMERRSQHVAITVTTPYEIGADSEPGSEAGAAFDAFVGTLRRLGEDKSYLGQAGALRSGDSLAPWPVSPKLTRLLDGRPTFAWVEARPDLVYRLEVHRVVAAGGSGSGSGSSDPPAAPALRVEARGAAWAWPSGRPPLAPGLYRYTLEALPGDATAEEEAAAAAENDETRRRHVSEPSKFLVLEPDEAERIRKEAEAFAAGLDHTGPRVRHMLLAAFYESPGIFLNERARQELLQAASAYPGDAGVRSLLQDLEERMLIRRYE